MSQASASVDYRVILANGLWHQNTGLVALLGLCPLLAVSNSVVNALGLGMATLLTLVVSNVCVSLARPLLRPEIRIPAYVVIIAATVTVIQLLMQAWLHELYRILGIFIPLIVTNCAIIARAEIFAARHRPLPAAMDGLATGLGFALALLALGSIRELFGYGTLFRQAELMLGDWASSLELVLLPLDSGFLLVLLPPGAFIVLGVLVAGKNWLDSRQPGKRAQPVAAPLPGGTGSTGSDDFARGSSRP